MADKKPFCITFAGPAGSSKTPIAIYLSYQLNLPVFSNDAIRSEVIGDLGSLDQDEYLRRRDKRLKELVKKQVSFIYDASVDRQWDKREEWRKQANYNWLIISLDLSKDFLVKLYQSKDRQKSLKYLDKMLAEHDMFVAQYGHDIGLHITDQDFPRRLELSYKKAKEFIKP